ncbi:ATP-dependent DNA helicase [Methanosalsum natronophilum]|nr:ATP-dependent DNA helicase [Methanosalsum natronophilum]MCS3923304.1 helicase [Methanosalsum natronophilum]
MKINELDIPEQVKGFYRDTGLVELYPPQTQAVENGILEGKNLVAAIPTASGKTFIAELAMHKAIGKGEKCLYIVPLRALASEKYNRFSEFSKLGIKVGITTGDFTSKDEWLGHNDIIVTTSEKADSLLRNETSWIKDISTVIVDEVHLLDSGNRGPTLEITLTRLMNLNPNAQIIALSATIGNPEDISNWLNANLIVSEWRPINLFESIFWAGKLYHDNEARDIKSFTDDNSINLTLDIINTGGQCLVFENSRKNCMSFAKKAGRKIAPRLDDHGKTVLESMAEDITEISESDISEVLSKCVRQGVAFHHAGLSAEHRKIVEDGFRSNQIKVISSTPTLAAGLNLPARSVIIRNYKRYDSNFGMVPIPVLDYKQMAGRAGRPTLDPFGESVLIAKSKDEYDYLLEKYINARPEDIWSKLGAENALRTHILALIVSKLASTYKGLLEFMEKTFFAYQGNAEDLDSIVLDCVNFLKDNEMIQLEGPGTSVLDSSLIPTRIGKLTSMLYIDPLSASKILEGLKNGNLIEDITLLHLVCSTPDMRKLYLRSSDYQDIVMYVMKNKEKFTSIPSEFKATEYEWFLGEVKTAKLLMDWINEIHIDEIARNYNVGEGDIRVFSETSLWLMHALSLLAPYTKKPEVSTMAKQLEKRIKYGVKLELVELVSLKRVGRSRARKLFKNGYRSIDELKEANPSNISKLIGSKITIDIFKQLDISVSLSELKLSRSEERTLSSNTQKTMSDFS